MLYIAKHFPCRSQTFLLNEVLGLIRKGVDVQVLSALKPWDAPVLPPDASELLEGRVHGIRRGFLYPLESADSLADNRPLQMLPAKAAEQVRCRFEMIEQDPERWPAAKETVESLGALIQQLNITHLHCAFGEDNLKLAYLAASAFDLSFSVKLHAYDIFAQPLPGLHHILPEAAFVATVCKSNCEPIARLGGIAEEQVKVVYDGVDTDGLQPGPLNHDDRHIVGVGRLVEKKGFIHLVRACAQFKRDGISFRCTIIGEGPCKEELVREVEIHQLKDEVNLVGAMDHRDAMKLLGGASVFCLPCVTASNGDRDATPNSMLEAMALGIPVVSSRLSGIPEIIEHQQNGLLTAPGNEAELAGALRQMLDDPELTEQLARKGRGKVENRFKIEYMVNGMAELFSWSSNVKGA